MSSISSAHSNGVELGLGLSNALAFAIQAHTFQRDVQAAVLAAARAADAALHESLAGLLRACAARAVLCCDRVPQMQDGLVPVCLRRVRRGRENHALLLAKARAKLCVKPEDDCMHPLRRCSCCLQAEDCEAWLLQSDHILCIYQMGWLGCISAMPQLCC